MTGEQRTELLDLYIDDALPEALRAHVENYLAAHPFDDQDVLTLRETVVCLRALPAERADAWFIERTLDSLLREHVGAQVLSLRTRK